MMLVLTLQERNMIESTQRESKVALADAQQRSVAFEYVDQQVAKDMAGFYSAFRIATPSPPERDAKVASRHQRETGRR